MGKPLSTPEERSTDFDEEYTGNRFMNLPEK